MQMQVRPLLTKGTNGDATPARGGVGSQAQRQKEKSKHNGTKAHKRETQGTPEQGCCH
jgi:hypothetical protein